MSAAIISDTATYRYGHAPQCMFAATRAYAEQRVRETAAAASSPARGVFRRLATRLALSVSKRPCSRFGRAPLACESPAAATRDSPRKKFQSGESRPVGQAAIVTC
jgi:hypothetical protein